MLKKLETVLYTAQTHTTGGREGHGKSSDGALDVRLSPPGSGRPGTNPEQLFAIGWSACFIGALGKAGVKHRITLPQGLAVDADVSLGKTEGGAEFALAAQLRITLPGLDAQQKRLLVETAHQTCPYSNATRGNIEVKFDIV